MPNVFELPGGHVEFGEDIVEGLKREILEELGVRIKVGDPFSVHEYVSEVTGRHTVEIVHFAALEDAAASIRLNPSDHASILWADTAVLDAVEPMTVPERRHAAKGLNLLNGGTLSFS